VKIEKDKIHYVDISFTLRISSEPVTEDDVLKLREGLTEVVEQAVHGRKDVSGDHDIDLFGVEVESVYANVEEHWDLEEATSSL
jgi:hypothetical protein